MTPLTPREVDVLRHAAQGRSVADTGTVMYLGTNTVKVHRKAPPGNLAAGC